MGMKSEKERIMGIIFVKTEMIFDKEFNVHFDYLIKKLELILLRK